ncbi:uracil-DNA glycosylase family protein [Parvularcula sp. LCG005]|uniref:uracil-DNA glycosylase family protein n=1 Tax=Parvularcula sp. LCG005 TaxID=3078805 RepID=UPI002942C166|nr:uracil-DNA glycosylase family protein [Parvularcula sp. LCG005]WOI54037.1 uracil-DNA glycosylase family protein [Parvularcula sp. LCG005]
MRKTSATRDTVSLAALREELSACRHCEKVGLIPAARPVFQLPADPVIGIFSQAPGNLAHQKGKPFYDPSGVRLRSWLGIDETIFYSDAVAIAPMAYCFPGYDGKGPTGRGGDLPPPKVCAERWRARVMAHILPSLKVVLLVGAYAQAWHLGTEKGRTLTETVAAWPDRFADAQQTGQLLLPMPHPSWRNTGWLKKNPWFEAEVIPRLQAAVQDALS